MIKFTVQHVKNMIARLPGAKTKFMGDNLEMICLFQAA
jgi:hypothetical protein